MPAHREGGPTSRPSKGVVETLRPTPRQPPTPLRWVVDGWPGKEGHHPPAGVVRGRGPPTLPRGAVEGPPERWRTLGVDPRPCRPPQRDGGLSMGRGPQGLPRPDQIHVGGATWLEARIASRAPKLGGALGMPPRADPPRLTRPPMIGRAPRSIRHGVRQGRRWPTGAGPRGWEAREPRYPRSHPHPRHDHPGRLDPVRRRLCQTPTPTPHCRDRDLGRPVGRRLTPRGATFDAPDQHK